MFLPTKFQNVYICQCVHEVRPVQQQLKEHKQKTFASPSKNAIEKKKEKKAKRKAIVTLFVLYANAIKI